MRTLYLECAFGISGDRLAAALLDLGADARALERAAMSLSIKGLKIRIAQAVKNGLDACRLQIFLEKDPGVSGLELIRQAEMTERARKMAKKIFRILLQAKTRAHRVPTVRSVVEILAVAVCLDDLDITEVIIPQLCEGTGTVQDQCGLEPVPVPAVLYILQEYGLPLQIISAEGGLVTPAGAAIAASIRTAGELPQRSIVKKIGIGTGERDLSCTDILRAMIIESENVPKAADADTIWKLEANIDDCTGERLGYAMECLFEAGAKDVHYTPVFMKKNRPAYQLNVFCDEKILPQMEEIIFRETTTIGIRRMQIQRSVLRREVREVYTSLGKAKVKVCSGSSGQWVYPEYESVAALARKYGLSYGQVEQAVVQEAARQGGMYGEGSEEKTPGGDRGF